MSDNSYTVCKLGPSLTILRHFNVSSVNDGSIVCNTGKRFFFNYYTGTAIKSGIG